jgi:hypothetical protein
VLLAVAFLALHLPYLPPTLEDLDSINFALGLHAFDVARHQPHPPGYPLYIAIGKASRALVDSDAKALAAVSVAAGALGVFAIAGLFRRVRPGEPWTTAATALAVASPLYWMTAARPLSDTVGLTAAVAVQALTLAAASPRGLLVAAFCGGLASGIRSQVVWLTLPLLALAAPRTAALKGPRHTTPAAMNGLHHTTPAAMNGLHHTTATALKGLVYTLVAFGAGVLVWFVPLVAITGGPAAYWQAVVNQGVEDLSGIQMLWTTPTVRELVDALYYAFVAPWAIWPLALVVLAFAAVGAVVLVRQDRRALLLLAIAFGPYLVFDIVFQETFTVRYALPIVVPVAFLAASGMRTLPRQPALAAAVLTAMFGAHLGGRSVAAYARQPAPVFRMLADMRSRAETGDAPVLAPDRRQSFDLRRPLIWLDDRAPRFDRQLAAPPQHEWLEAVKYWNEGGRAPVWFVVDPRRAAIDLVEHGDPAQYRWSLPYPVLMSGTRPGEADLYDVGRPDWYVGNGWALTPEAAGISRRDGADSGPRSVWISPRVAPGYLMLGGRNLDSRPHDVLVRAGDDRVAQFSAAPGFFVHFEPLKGMDAADRGGYLPLTIASAGGAQLALEQFDAAGSSPILAYGDGFFEHEYDPATGRQWRWLGAHGELSYVAQAPAVLEIRGESPRKYYRSESRLTIRAGGAVLQDVRVGDDFAIRVPVPAALTPATIVVETDQTHVPADTSWRGSADRRRLGVRIFSCELRTAR